MSIQQEEILIKEFTSGTTITYFSTHLQFNRKLENVTSAPPELIPTIVHLNNLNQVSRLSTFDGKEVWTLDGNNVYTQQNEYTILTGYSFTIEKNTVISSAQTMEIRSLFEESMDLTYNTLSSNTVYNGVAFSGTSLTKVDYVFVNYVEIDDFYVNVKLNRTTATLDTFNVYNNLTNSIPTQDAKTGVVFGRLMALQTIKDSEGNNVRIPLRNVPVGIFNSSVDYPTSSSVSENGDRIFLNLKESVSPDEYFNVESFNFDKNKLLRSGSEFASVPEQYKYITKTNDEGEFVLYDVPIGNQIAVFEVDLLQQGLTRDEIALNFFPFPPDEDAIIDQIPNFSFKQFPINVVPAWGTIQTGYTELDVVVNMDLRKWTTYFFPPVSLYGQRLEASVAQNAGNTLKIKVRNMAKQGYPNIDIKLAEVQNDLDRVFNQQLNWQLEFAQIKNKAEYYKFGCPILKLPANLYDPNGYKTDLEGIPTNQKGVWLSAYQLKLSTSNTSASRATGGIYAWGDEGFYFKSHYDVNYALDIPNTSPHPLQNGTLGLGKFPYEKPWTIDYPNPYSIPKKPVIERYGIWAQGRAETSTPGVYYLDEPAYSDGDLVGYEVGPNKGGGFGSQQFEGIYFHNRIAESVTQNFMYKYESQVGWTETYANGYQPSNPGYVRFAGESSVVGGEKYQRFESGYGYFLKPLGWPRVARTPWAQDTHFKPDVLSVPGTVASTEWGWLWSSYSHISDVYNIDSINLALALDDKNILKEGTLEAYRVIDPSPDNLASPENFVLPTGVRVINNAAAGRANYMEYWNNGDIPVEFRNSFGGGANVATHFGSNGAVLANVPSGTSFILAPGERLRGWGSFDIEWTTFTLPGNANYNPVTNRYDRAKYIIKVLYNGGSFYGQLTQDIMDVQTGLFPNSLPEYYVKTVHEGGGGGLVSYGLNTNQPNNSGESESDRKVYYVRIQTTPAGVSS